MEVINLALATINHSKEKQELKAVSKLDWQVEGASQRKHTAWTEKTGKIKNMKSFSDPEYQTKQERKGECESERGPWEKLHDAEESAWSRATALQALGVPCPLQSRFLGLSTTDVGLR